MKNKNLLWLVVMGLFLATACQDCEECEDCPVPPVNITETEWTMSYIPSSGTPTYYDDQTFIGGGRAYYPSYLFKSGQWFTSFILPVPEEIDLNMDTDTVTLVARLRNVAGDGVAYEIDMGIAYATGIAFSAAFQKSGPGALQYSLLQVGSQVLNNLSEHIIDNTTYADYGITVLGAEKKLSSTKNGSPLRTFSYTGSTGYAQYLTFAFRGYGECDWIKLYKGSKLIMTEEFNTDGKTTAVWTLP